jgi:hypothetical protein
MNKHDDFVKKQEIFGKRLPNGVPKSDSILRNLTLAPLLAPLAPQVVFFTQKMQPKCSKGGPKVAKVTPKGIPKWLKWVPGNGQIIKYDSSLLSVFNRFYCFHLFKHTQKTKQTRQ